MDAILQVSGKPRAQTIHVSGHHRQKPDRFTQQVIQTAIQMQSELAAENAEYVRALEVGLADFSGE
ncbi:hypothetical protein BG46_15860 [Brucella anthropi]|uniref:hypothetical protein n=1 Tax=Brucella anthropi TaxID=529 RepID=UPI000447AAD0|nr:hypothetical protein [Brucella anthropi]EXL06558.1 hypothetical protein BG46_15860 [Brucella anthropi]